VWCGICGDGAFEPSRGLPIHHGNHHDGDPVPLDHEPSESELLDGTKQPSESEDDEPGEDEDNGGGGDGPEIGSTSTLASDIRGLADDAEHRTTVNANGFIHIPAGVGRRNDLAGGALGIGRDARHGEVTLFRDEHRGDGGVTVRESGRLQVAVSSVFAEGEPVRVDALPEDEPGVLLVREDRETGTDGIPTSTAEVDADD